MSQGRPCCQTGRTDYCAGNCPHPPFPGQPPLTPGLGFYPPMRMGGPTALWSVIPSAVQQVSVPEPSALNFWFPPVQYAWQSGTWRPGCSCLCSNFVLPECCYSRYGYCPPPSSVPPYIPPPPVIPPIFPRRPLPPDGRRPEEPKPEPKDPCVGVTIPTGCVGPGISLKCEAGFKLETAKCYSCCKPELPKPAVPTTPPGPGGTAPPPLGRVAAAAAFGTLAFGPLGGVALGALMARRK